MPICPITGNIIESELIPRIDREELAWVAGFYDGEGCCSIRHYKEDHPRYNISNPVLFLTIAQSDKYILKRVNKALLNIGKIYGPVKGNHKDKYKLNVYGFEKVQAIISLIWFKLDISKRNQYIYSIKEYDRIYNPNLVREGHARGVKYKKLKRAV